VAVVFQCISLKEKRRVLALVLEYFPSSKVLELYQPDADRVLETADDWLPAPADDLA
jgi:hypothetical protein